MWRKYFILTKTLCWFHVDETANKQTNFQVISAANTRLYLVVCQRVESLPVALDLSCHVFVLQDDPCEPTLTPL